MPMRPSDLEVTHKDAQVNGVRLHYVEKGRADAPLVVLLHGFPESWWSWRYQIDPLVEAGYRVVAPDLRGYNTSEKKGPYDIDTLVADVCALIDHAKAPSESSKVLVVGHDWGGAVAWHLAATRPEHCARLVVMNCPHPVMLSKALQSKWSQIKKSWYMFFFLVPFVPERLLTANHAAWVKKVFLGCAVDRSNFRGEEIEPLLQSALVPGAAHGMIEWYRAALKQSLFDRKRMKGYAKIEVPSLLIWAKDDIALGFDDLVPGTERYAPKLRVEPIEKCGHFVQAEQPKAVNEKLVAFLREGGEARAQSDERSA